MWPSNFFIYVPYYGKIKAIVILCIKVSEIYQLACNSFSGRFMPRNLEQKFNKSVCLQNVDHKMKLRSKKGQLPFVELNGEEIADSAIILKELGQRFEKDLDAGLSNDQKNVSHAMISMIENHLVW